ncbi:hypothetical protein BGZ96_001556 [Linnemannia gamsii]|uniref:Uncharacterized protein n=1 Tax=Linnemannia gamsii TaxID=64522 RepID=A0ABQ7JME1_9FUNG|nr:hypothetical protein BGZ96_001556 [Linnemannia gamsii]
MDTSTKSSDCMPVVCNNSMSERVISKKKEEDRSLGNASRIYMLVSVPLRKQLFVLKWKSIQIDYIKIGSGARWKRVNVLVEFPMLVRSWT